MDKKAYYLRNDIRSHFAPYKAYGWAGDKVFILYNHNDMMIVQDESGNIFHSRTDNLSETPTSYIPQHRSELIPEATNSRRPSKTKAAPIIQSNLF